MKATILGFIMVASITVTGVGCRGLFESCVEGSGELTSEKRTVAPFREINIKGSADVVLRQGNVQDVKVEAESNILPLITTTVENNVMSIDNRECYSTDKGVRVYVTIPDVRALRINGSGSFIGESGIVTESGPNGGPLSLEVNGSGDISLDVNVGELRVEIDGSGDVALKGKATQETLTISGSGNINAFDLAGETCVATIRGSGNGSVNVSKSLRASISGSGNIIYTGPVTDVTSNVSGSGDIRRR